MTETIQETRMREAMEPLGEILGSLQLARRQEKANIFAFLALIVFVGSIVFTKNDSPLEKRILIFVAALLMLAAVAYIEYKRFRHIKSVYKAIEQEPYETKNDLIRSKILIEDLLPKLYPKNYYILGFGFGFIVPFNLLNDFLNPEDVFTTNSHTRFWESPYFIVPFCILFGIGFAWITYKNYLKQKQEHYLQHIEQLQWFIDHYDTPNGNHHS
jgi:hypothetical protein